jgi:S-adenosyl methyltransferase
MPDPPHVMFVADVGPRPVVLLHEPCREGHRDIGDLVSDAERLAATPGTEALDISVAHPARVYDVWLGGKDHFAADRTAAEHVIRANPWIVPGVRSNRGFLARVVRYLVREAGVTQFLDLGTGLPSANNVHEVAQSMDPGARIVYVDNDPIVLVHARALLTGAPGTVAYIDADIRDADSILDKAGDTLDLTRPVAVMLLMTLQFIPDEDDPFVLVHRFMNALPSGSHLVISCPESEDGAQGEAAKQGTARYNRMVATPMTRRSRAEIGRFFEGLDIVEPGYVHMSRWRPDPGGDLPEQFSPAVAVVARKR